MKKHIIFIIISCLSTYVLFGQAGELDPGFADNGILEWDASGAFDRGQAITIQPDGKIVVALNGAFPNSNGSDIGVVRMNEDGSHDTSFGENGVYFYSNPIGFDAATDVIILEDEKILVSGWLSQGGAFSDFVVIKLNTDGTPDTSFGTDGVKSWSIFEDGSADIANCLAVTEDGKILVGGQSRLPLDSYHSNVICRLNPDGLIDSTFGSYGIYIWNPDNTPKETHKLDFADDGSILAAGHSRPAGTDRHSLYKINEDGSGLDSTFAINGEALAPFEGTAYGMDIHPNGNILLSGQSRTVNGMDLLILAYKQDGTLNASFGFDGVFLMDVDVFDDSYGIAVQQDGKIIAAGSTGGPIFSGGTPSFFSVRVDESGLLDNTWGNDGMVITGGAQDYSFANDIAIQSNGKVLLTGFEDNGSPDLRVVRYGNFIDQDEDGFGLEEDCNDLDMAINPDAEEIPNNEIDEDCDGMDLTVGTVDNTLLEKILVYPNPAKDHFTIETTGNDLYFESIRIMTVGGKLLKTFDNPGAEKIQVFSIDHLPQGPLWIIIQTNEGRAVRLLLKQ